MTEQSGQQEPVRPAWAAKGRRFDLCVTGDHYLHFLADVLAGALTGACG